MRNISSLLRTAKIGALRKMARLPFAHQSPFLSWYRPVDIKTWTEQNPSRHKLIRAGYQANHPFPMNVESPDNLPGLAPPLVCDLAIRDVPQLNVAGSFLAEMDNCWIVRTRYEWGGSEFCICTSEGQPLRFHGLISAVGNTAMRQAFYQALNGKHETLDQATWVVGYWYNNYYHWFIEWLPRIILALEQGLPAQTILLPPLMGQWAWDSLSRLKLTPHWLSENCDAWRVGRLTIVSESPHHGPAHQAVTRRLLAGMSLLGEGRKKIWISRRSAVHRRLYQEPQIEAWLSSRGWHIVEMERLCLEEQMKLMSCALAMAGLHGAGFANIIFTSPGTPILEIVVQERPCAGSYALASCLGNPYWYVSAKTAGKNPSLIHDDAEVSLDEFKVAIIDLEHFLEQRAA